MHGITLSSDARLGKCGLRENMGAFLAPKAQNPEGHHRKLFLRRAPPNGNHPLSPAHPPQRYVNLNRYRRLDPPSGRRFAVRPRLAVENPRQIMPKLLVSASTATEPRR